MIVLQIMIGNEALELVDKYTYLGQMVSANPAHEKEMRWRIRMGWSAFGKQNLVMNSNLPLSLKRMIYNHCILPVLTYGLETWRLTKELERKLRSALKGNGEKNAGCNMERQETSIMDQGTDQC